MIPITINGKPFRLIENAREISGKRMTEFDAYHLKMLIGTNAEHVLASIRQFNERFNIDSMSAAHLALNNALLTAQGILSRRNPIHYAFACILLCEEEWDDQANEMYLSDSFLQEKVIFILDSGMAHAEIEAYVENFITALLKS